MIQNVRKSDLRLLTSFDYKIIATHETAPITVTKPLPECTGDYDRLPAYLKGFEEFYEKRRWGGYRLKDKYLRERPTYSITVVNKRYDVELTADGRETAEERLALHKRLAAYYTKLLA